MIASSHGKATQQNEETCIGCNQMFIANASSMNGTWNTYLRYSILKNKINQLQKVNDKFFNIQLWFKNNTRIYIFLEAKFGRKIGIFSLALKKQHFSLRELAWDRSFRH